MWSRALIVAAVQALVVSGAEFRNLGFEEANTSGLHTGDTVPLNQLLPGWTVRSGTNVETYGGFDGISLGWPAIVGDARLIKAGGATGINVDGNYALDFTPVLRGDEMSISQTGLVPLDAKTIRFMAASEPFFGPQSQNFYDVEVNGTRLDLLWRATPGAGMLDWNVAGDVSAYAGQEVDLVFRTRFQTIGPFSFPMEDYALDTIIFSPVPLPEPNIAQMGLLGISLLLIGRIWRAKSRIRALRPLARSDHDSEQPVERTRRTIPCDTPLPQLDASKADRVRDAETSEEHPAATQSPAAP